jgi:hypothetical protein
VCFDFFTNFFRNISHSKKKNIGPIFKGEEIQEGKKALEDGTDRLSRKLGNELPHVRCVISQNSADPI